MSINKIKIGNQAAKDSKVNDDFQLIMSKYKEMPLEDIRIMKIEVYYTDAHIAGFTATYQLVDQKKKNNKKRKISDNIFFEFEGHKSKGSKFFGVKSEEFILIPQEQITKIFGQCSEQIDKISFFTSLGKSYNFPPNNPVDPKKNKDQQFYFEIPDNSIILTLSAGFSRFLNYIEINYKSNPPPIMKSQNFALNQNNVNRFQSQFQPNSQIQQNMQFNNNIPIQGQNNLINNPYSQPNQQGSFNYPPPPPQLLPPQPQPQPQPQFNQMQYNYPTESQINFINKNNQPQQFQQPFNPQNNNNMNNNNSNLNHLNNNFNNLSISNNFNNYNPNIPNNNNNIGLQNQNSFGMYDQQKMNNQPNFYQPNQYPGTYPPAPPPPPPGVNEQDILSYPIQNQQLNQNPSFQRSNTVQLPNSNQNNSNLNFGNNNIIQNGVAGSLLISQQDQMRSQNQFPSQLIRGSSVSNSSPQSYLEELKISETLQKILFNENPIFSMKIVSHKINQKDHSFLSKLSSMGSSHVNYQISIEYFQGNQQNIIINRRYKEFDALRDCLLEVFPGLPIPMLPNKTIVKNLDEKFIEERKEELQVFLDDLLNFNILMKYKGTQLFLDLNVNSKTLLDELEKMKNSFLKNKHQQFSEYKLTFQIIDNYQLKSNQIEEVEQFKKLIVKKLDHFEKLVLKAQETKEKMDTYYSFLNKFKKNFVKDYEEQVLQGYKEIDGRKFEFQHLQNVMPMNDQDIMIQQTLISGQRFIQQHSLILREFRILTEFTRLFTYQQQLTSNFLKLSQKLLKAKQFPEQNEIQAEMNYTKWMELFITKLFYFCLIPFHKKDQTKRYITTVQNVSKTEQINSDNMRQYWLFVMLREQIQYDETKKVEQAVAELKQQQYQEFQIKKQQKLLQLQQQKEQQLLKQQQDQKMIIQNNNQQSKIANNSLLNGINYPPKPESLQQQQQLLQQQPQQQQQQQQVSQLYSQIKEEQKGNQEDFNNYYQHYSNINQQNQQKSQLNYSPLISQMEKQLSQSKQSETPGKNDKEQLENYHDDQIYLQPMQLKPISNIKQKLIHENRQSGQENQVFQQLFLEQLGIDDYEYNNNNNNNNNGFIQNIQQHEQQDQLTDQQQQQQQSQLLKLQQQQQQQNQHYQQQQYQQNVQQNQYQEQQQDEDEEQQGQLLEC